MMCSSDRAKGPLGDALGSGSVVMGRSMGSELFSYFHTLALEQLR
jgi:hypothetical protein